MTAASESTEPKDMSQSFDRHFQNEDSTDVPEVNAAAPEQSENKTPEFIQFIKERDTLQASLKQKELELYNSQGRNYELLKKIDVLEAQVKDLKKGSAKPSTPKTGSPVLPHKALSPAKKKPAAAKKQVTKPGKKKGGDSSKNEYNHPPISGKEALSEDSQAYYTEIADLFPLLRLSTFLAVEKKFKESDVNCDGTIDAEELEIILTNNVVMYTKSECAKILKDLDQDGTGTLDFVEVLKIVDQLSQNKKTNLPMHLTSEASKSAICCIQ